MMPAKRRVRVRDSGMQMSRGTHTHLMTIAPTIQLAMNEKGHAAPMPSIIVIRVYLAI